MTIVIEIASFSFLALLVVGIFALAWKLAS